MARKTWLVTGASSGLGLAIAETALRSGHRVVATARNVTKASSSHPHIEQLGGTWLQLDVSVHEAKGIVEQAISRAGSIDVLVNNAGYSLLGSIEDMSENEVEDQFNTNVYGPIRMIQAVLPTMREEKSGVIVNISSIAGLDGRPSGSIYSATKFALEGISEALSRELAPFGIRTLIVEPGGLRTRFLDAYREPEKGLTKAYEGTPVHQVLTAFRSLSGKQQGDPLKAAQRIVEVVDGTGLGKGKSELLRLPLGPDCLVRDYMKVDTLRKDLDESEVIAKSTNFE